MNELIQKHKINCRHLADLMGMQYTTLKKKLDPKQWQYCLTAEEIDMIKRVIREYGKQLQKDFK